MSKQKVKESPQNDANMNTLPPEIEIKDAVIHLKPSRRKKIRKTKVLLEGSLTINNVNQFKEEVTPLFDSYDYVDFQLKNIDRLDLSYIQMLFHLKQFYGNRNKSVTIDSELSGEIKKVVVQSGFEDLMFLPKLVS